MVGGAFQAVVYHMGECARAPHRLGNPVEPVIAGTGTTCEYWG
jgi:hypothetical protein